MILDSTSKSLQVVLSGAPAANQASFIASYADLSTTQFIPGNNDALTNGVTAVTVVAAPGAGLQRQVKHLALYNADTAAMTVTVQLLDGATVRPIYKATLNPGATLEWSQDSGFKVPTASAVTTPDFISGLQLSWVSASSLTISGGEAWIPAASAIVSVPSPVTLTGIALGNNAWGYVYLKGDGTFEVVTTSPAAPYLGTARTKTGDTTRRYVGAVRTDGSGNIWNFRHVAGRILYQGYLNQVPFTVLTGGTATAETNVDLSAAIPVGTTSAYLRHTNNAVTAASRMNNTTATFPNYVVNYGTPVDVWMDFIVNSNLSVSYWLGNAPTSGGVNIQVFGYTLER